MRHAYFLRRLKQAPFRIIVRKLFERLKKASYIVGYYFRRYFKRVCQQNPEDLPVENLMELGNALRAGLLSAQKNTQWCESACKRAQDFLDNGFPILGYGNVNMQSEINWHDDSFHGFSWSPKYFNNIDFVATNEYCDVKVPWELSRFQYLLWLSEGYLLDPKNEHRYLEAFERIVEDWLRQNPAGFGVNWIVSMEVAIRGCNLALAASVFSRVMRTELLQKVVVSLQEHRTFIHRFPEFSDVSGNHYLANLMGVAVLDSCLSGSSSAIAMKSRDIFYKEADVQFESDGCQIERAPIYHRLCLDMVAIVFMFELRGEQVSGYGLEILQRGVTFANAVSSSKGLLPVFGDADSGHILWFKEVSRDFRGLSEIVRCANIGADFSSTIDSNTIWLMLISGRFSLSVDTFKRKHNNQERVYNLSGYCATHDGSVDVVMRVGSQGLKGRASHDHDDALSIWVFLKGRDFIVERGCYSYTLCPVERSKDIGSLHHNLVQPVGENRSSSNKGSIVQTAVGAQTASNWDVSDEESSVSIAALMKKVTNGDSQFDFYQRNVRCTAECDHTLTVEDRWAWRDGPQPAELRWHFPPDLCLEISPEEEHQVKVFLQSGECLSNIKFKCFSKFKIEKFSFDFSEVYGQKVKSTGLKLILDNHDECKFVSKFYFL